MRMLNQTPHANLTRTLSSAGMMALLLIFPLSHAAMGESREARQPVPGSTGVASQATAEKSEAQKNLANEPAARGKLLYENHCISCHESMVHIRAASKAKTYEDIQYWVGRWASELKIKWSADEIDDVVEHLNQTFYHY